MHVPFAVDEELLEVPSHITGFTAISSGLTEAVEEGESVGSIHIDFCCQRKRDVVLGGSKVADFLVSAWLLRTKLVAGEPDHGQVIVHLVKFLQAGVLGSGTTGAGDVHHQPPFTSEVSQCGCFSVHHGKGFVKQVRHGCSFSCPIMNMCFASSHANPLQVPLCGMVMQVLMETSAGNITIDLFHGSAPDTVANFVKLVEMGHYDGLHFHRVIEDFMIQGGCPHSKDPMSRRAGTGGPGWQIPCEPSALALKHDKPGVLSMANAGRNTGGSQFFLTTVPTPWLNGNHAVFGAVSEGMDVVHTIERCRKLPGDRPAEPQQIIRCTVVE